MLYIYLIKIHEEKKGDLKIIRLNKEKRTSKLDKNHKINIQSYKHQKKSTKAYINQMSENQ